MHSYFRYTLTLLLVCSSITANAWDWIYRETTETNASFYPRQLAASQNSGFWALGRANGDGALAHYAMDGSIRTLHSSPYHDQLAAMADGGVVTAGWEGASSGTKCTARRYDASGSLRWISATDDISCSAVFTDGGGSIWLLDSSRRLYLLAPDGRVVKTIGQFASTAPYIPGYIADPNQNGIFIANSAYDEAANASAAAITALDESGSERWRYRSNAINTRFTSLVLGTAGALYGVGTCGSGSTSRLYIAKLSRDGSERWNQCYDAIPDGYSLTAMSAPENGLHVMSNTDSGAVLRRFGENGALMWSYELDTGDRCVEQDNDACVSTIMASGETLLLTHSISSSSSGQRIIRINAGGNLVSSAPLIDIEVSSLIALADGSVVVVANKHVAPPGPSATFPESLIELKRFARDGSELAAPVTTHVAPISSEPIASRFSDDGTAYVVMTDSDTASYAMSRISNAGERVWRAESMGSWPNAARISNITDRACVAGERVISPMEPSLHVECNAADGGAKIWQADLNTGAAYQSVLELRITDSGTIRMVYLVVNYLSMSGIRSAEYDRFGNLISNTEIASTDWVTASAMSADGSVALAFDRPNTRLVALLPDGSIRFSASVDAADLAVSKVALAPDGSLLAIGDRIEQGTHVAFARLYAPAGQVLWTTRLGPLSTPSGTIVFDQGSAYLALGYGGIFIGSFLANPSPLQVNRVSLTDGNLLWQRNLQGDYLARPKLFLDGSRQTLLIANAWRPNRIETYVLDQENGSTISERYEGCAATECVASISVTPDGTLHAVVNTHSDDSAPGYQTQVYSRTNSTARPDSIRLDQSGLNGAWYASYETGQGFMLDYFPANRTLFMPWFTYARSTSRTADPNETNNHPSGQRWYTLQGTVPVGAVSAELQIVENSGGTFDAGPATVARTAGNATLTFSSCSSGSLHYRFDAAFNGGVEGFVMLTRLTPATNACILPNGSESTVSIPPASNGFDARQSGSWYAPATAGQGLMFTVQPNGLFFAAWFTYDPAGQADDATQQHWFTLQGDLGSATNGTVTLPIIQTIGGTFDLAPTSNSYRVGEATLRMQGCDRAQLEYRFDAGVVATPYALRQGSVGLEKIGGCGL